MASTDNPEAQLVFNMGSIEDQIINEFHEVTITKISLKEEEMKKKEDMDTEVQSSLALSRTVKEEVEFGDTENMKIAPGR